jgi:hypothetical protein
LSILLPQQARDRRAVRLVGVCVSNLVRGTRQMDLFADNRQYDLLAATDAINDRYGEFAIMRGSLVGLKASVKTHGFDGRPMG